MDMSFQDSLGNALKVGTRVLVGDPQDAEAYGRVSQISDPDGDVDDEGRSVFIPPRVTVRFDSDGSEDHFLCHSDWYARSHPDDDYVFVCEDIEVDTRMLPALCNRDPGDETQVAA